MPLWKYILCGSYRVANGEIASCGCKRRVYRENNFKQARKALNVNYKEGTYIALIRNNKLRNTNKSGYTGVYYCNSKQKWVANLMFQHKNYKKTFKNKEDAIKYRKELEEKYFKPILEKYKKINCPFFALFFIKNRVIIVLWKSEYKFKS